MKHIRNIFFVAIILSPVTESGFAQSTSNYKSVLGFNYQEIVRGNEKTKLPLLIAFHFSSSSPEELMTYFDSLSFPVRIIIPRGNYPKRGGHSYLPKDHYSQDTATQIKTVRATVDSMALFIEHFAEKHNTKPIVSGISQGGDLALLLAIYYPQLIRASFPLLGFIHRQVYEDLPKPAGPAVPIYLYHGEEDKIVSIRYVKKEFEFLKKSFNVTSHFYPKVEHDVTSAMEKNYSQKMMTLLQKK
jgi:predicted esterase